MSSAQKKRDSTALIGSGVGVAALGAVGAAVGVVCPLCVVAAPALVGAGLVQRWRARKADAPVPASEASSSKVEPSP